MHRNTIHSALEVNTQCLLRLTPPQSPDLDIFEPLWISVKRQKHHKKISRCHVTSVQVQLKAVPACW